MSKTIQRHQIADKASLSAIRKSIRYELSGAGIDPAEAFDCMVAITEACTNALVHGRDCDGEEPDPEIAWDIGASYATFWVRDFSSARLSRMAHPAGELSSGEDTLEGMGIALMRDLMDEVRIQRSPTGTEVILKKDFSLRP